ncbi:hypothetical protein FRC12_013552 [Ceratobasidium sp. 428]|nr:hypothetical protein FRC12_013552 [Ceratobasidium sp. 428]
MTEDEVANGLYSCLVSTLKEAKGKGLLDDADLASQDMQWLVTCGLALLLTYAANSGTAVPNIALPCPEDRGRRLDASTCPPEFRPYFERWAGLVPRIQTLPQSYVHDLALLVLWKSPITLPKEVPNPFPFFPTPEQQARKEIHEWSSELFTISNAVSIHPSFSPLWKEKLCVALSEQIQTSTVPTVITDHMVCALSTITLRYCTDQATETSGSHHGPRPTFLYKHHP